jgi:hypothetical protein
VEIFNLIYKFFVLFMPHHHRKSSGPSKFLILSIFLSFCNFINKYLVSYLLLKNRHLHRHHRCITTNMASLVDNFKLYIISIIGIVVVYYLFWKKKPTVKKAEKEGGNTTATTSTPSAAVGMGKNTTTTSTTTTDAATAAATATATAAATASPNKGSSKSGTEKSEVKGIEKSEVKGIEKSEVKGIDKSEVELREILKVKQAEHQKGIKDRQQAIISKLNRELTASSSE